MILPRHRHCFGLRSFSYQPPSTKKMRNALGWWWHTRMI